MRTLEELRAANPDLRLYAVTDPEFEPYGRILSVSGPGALEDAMRSTAIPESGNCYVASLPALESVPAMQGIRRCVYGEMPIQAGYCNGRGFTLNAEEYHKCSEVNFSTTGLVLLLALPGDLRGGKLSSKDVVGFYLPAGIAVEIFPLVLHFAPCRIDEAGFNCLVVLEAGTNAPLDRTDSTAPGEEKMLWMKNKWMLCHPDSPQAEKGAYVGITGENLTLKL